MVDQTPRRALVTGGAHGIGKAIPRDLAAKGWRVAVLDFDAAALEEMDDTFGLLPIPCDLTRERDIRAAVAEAGFDRLDFPVNNGGPAIRFVARWKI